MRNFKTLILMMLINFAFQSLALADIAHPWRDEDSQNGYTAKVDAENEDTGVILYNIEDPNRNDVALKDKIFDPKLSKEITNRYYEKFGRTEAQIIQDRTPYLNTNFSQGDSTTFNEQDYQLQQRNFGNYVIRRVAEYHFDEESRTNPDLKAVYNTKQKLEKVDVSFSDNFKMRGKYELAANTFVVSLKNPYVNFETRFEFADHETVYSMYRDLGYNYSFITDYYIQNPTLDIIGKKAITSNLGVTLTYSPYHHFNTLDINQPVTSGITTYVNETRMLAGMNYKF